jgi:hypothetical protein
MNLFLGMPNKYHKKNKFKYFFMDTQKVSQEK